MKTLNNLRDASTIFALCTAFVFFLTGCEKEDLATLNNTQSADQTLQCLNCNEEASKTDYANFTAKQRNELTGNHDAERPTHNNVDNARNGQMPDRIADNKLTPVDVPTFNRIAQNNQETNAYTELNKLVQEPKDVNRTKDRLVPLHTPKHN